MTTDDEAYPPLTPENIETALRQGDCEHQFVLDGSLGAVIREVSTLIDSTYPTDLDREAHLFRRVMKIAEEVGEVTEALFGALGENPRKGQTHRMSDVRRELLDVALAALTAICHFDSRHPIDALDSHARMVRQRLYAALEDHDD